MDNELANYDSNSGKWFTFCTGPTLYEEWTDIVIYPGGAPTESKP